MEQEWKQSLYAYVDQVNKGRVAPGTEPRHSSVKDPRFLVAQGERSRRLAEWYSRRGITPLRGETGVRTVRTVRQNPYEVVADVALHSALYYEKGGISQREDVIDSERLTFVRGQAGWEIATVERSVPERNSLRRPLQAEPALRFSKWGEPLAEPQPSQPLLNRKVLRGGSAGAREVRYRREEAAAYADRWWKDGNPEFEIFEVDCTNYVSQCLFAGGAPIHYTGKRETGWWYKGYNGAQEWWSYSWAVSDSLQRYLSAVRPSGLRAEAVDRPEQLMLGDVIQYDWDGNGHYQHSTIVTAFDAEGLPLVNARTVSSRHRFWDYRDSYAWTDKTAYRFFHINDYL
ncbi:amidase domain-containing protein [Paenibacillus tepidiphilus]|uniref:amidase domain-containing protein n=1 Tax=Paenibacillus tepidiphilus TaxID=2608683 RepID=UPI00123AD394|nr:amidase domain-containing protein [Paenibacillus tepidiphilus]